MTPGVAHAVLGTVGTPAGFQIDGQLYSGPTGDDWAQGSSSNGIFQGASRTPSVLPSVSFRDDNWAGSASDVTAFAGSSNKNSDYIGSTQSPWTTAPGSGPQKNDFTDIYVTSRVEFVPGPPPSTNIWLIVGGTTRAVNGDSHVDFEFNRAGIQLVPGKPDKLVGQGSFGGRSIGDVIVSVDEGIGGTSPTITIRRWQEVVPATVPPSYAFVDVTPASAGTHFMVVDNVGTPTGPWGGVAPGGSLIPAGSNMVAYQFFEGAVNLTLAGINPTDLCSATSTMTVKSRSSDSFTAELKDYALVPFSIVTSPTCSIDGPGSLCSGVTGTTYSVTTDAPNPSYLWSITGNGTINGSATGSSVVVDAGAAGSFNLAVSITAGAGGVCGTSCNKSVTINPNPTVSVAPVTLCASALPATLTAVGSGGTAPYTFSWTGPGGFTGSGASISASTGGTYNVTITDASSTHCTGTGSGLLTVNPNPTVSVAPVSICASAAPGTLTAVGAGGTGPYTYSWTGPGGFTGSGASISVGTGGTYHVTVTDASSTHCTGTGSGLLTINPNPTVTVAPVAVCAGALPATLTAVGAGGTGPYTFSWTGPGGFTATGNPISASTAGSYNVTITDASSTHCTGTGTGNLSINPDIPVSVAPVTLCASALPATLTASPSGAQFSYSWTGPGGFTGSGNPISVTVAGTYNVTVTNTTTLCSGTAPGVLTVNPNPTVTVAPVTVCASALPATLTALGSGGTGPYTYSWTGPGGFTGSGASISVSTGGTYNVTVTDNSSTHCTGTGSGLLTVNANPTVTVAPVTVCASAVPASLTAVGAGGTAPYTFSWTGPGGFTGTGATISVSTGGTYNVTVTDGSSTHCTGTGSGLLTVNPNPSVTVANVTICASALPASLTAVPAGGTAPFTFSWTGPGGFTATGNPISTSTAGTYTVTVTDASSTHCTATGSGDLTINPNPTVTAGSATVCASALPASLTAVGSGGTSPYTFAWTGPGGFTGTGATISVSTQGTYNVTITDASSTHCTGTGSGSLTVNPNPVVVATGDILTCLKTSGQVTATSTPPGQTYGWTGPNGFTSTQQNPAVCDSGTYTVTVTTSAGCTGTASAHVSITIPVIAPCGSGGPITAGFELDGDASAGPAPGDDWDLVYGGTDTATMTTGVVPDFPSKADDYFQIGTKDLTDVTSWRYNINSTPDKDDILHGGAAQYGGLLYFFGDRFDNSGDAQIGFWFLQDTVNVVVPGSTFTGKHQVGDLLVLSNFTSGGTNPVIFAYEWVGSGGSDGTLNKLTLNASNSFATVNSAPKPSPWPFQAKGKAPANTFPVATFFEGGIDLGCLTGAGVSACFSNFILETRSSASVTASLKDFLIGHFSPEAAGLVATRGLLPLGEQAALEAVHPTEGTLPVEYALMQALPNPFRGNTLIGYALPEASKVSIKVYNVQGQQVASLVNGVVDAGYRSVSWNARDRAGRPASSGIYFYRLEATGLKTGTSHEQLRKMLLLK